MMNFDINYICKEVEKIELPKHKDAFELTIPLPKFTTEEHANKMIKQSLRCCNSFTYQCERGVYKKETNSVILYFVDTDLFWKKN